MKDLLKKILNPYRIFTVLASKEKLKWLNDKIAIRLIFRGQMGESLSLSNPKSFNQKIQWLKIYDRNPLYTQLVDKHEVRSYVKEWIGEEYLIDELGIWDRISYKEINSLPEQFVLKCTHDSGSTIVCRDKNKLDYNKIILHLNNYLNRSHYWSGLEWPYKNVKPRIIAEKFMTNGSNEGLTDYKFYCFNGTPRFLYISTGLENHSKAKISFFDFDGNILPFGRNDYNGFKILPQMPTKLNEMINISEICSHKIGAPFLRVDLYEINQKVYFSEFTFHPCGGYMPFNPKKYDYIIGEMLDIKNGVK